MKQLDVVVSPPAVVWDPYMTLTHVTFDLDIDMNFDLVNFYLRLFQMHEHRWAQKVYKLVYDI